MDLYPKIEDSYQILDATRPWKVRLLVHLCAYGHSNSKTQQGRHPINRQHQNNIKGGADLSGCRHSFSSRHCLDDHAIIGHLLVKEKDDEEEGENEDGDDTQTKKVTWTQTDGGL
ncbi:hypothetical protein AVEN_238065-1 [Araneus ventricosus]|uniref:Uncharacterized protein n=1 Tax=Araneus ventricosus TaxID=182803 RepID=A0A4Y2I154_ARAVE|nr:hypothetical protein AVEN_238065-1 [Araneus ventricosus]